MNGRRYRYIPGYIEYYTRLGICRRSTESKAVPLPAATEHKMRVLFFFFPFFFLYFPPYHGTIDTEERKINDGFEFSFVVEADGAHIWRKDVCRVGTYGEGVQCWSDGTSEAQIVKQGAYPELKYASRLAR